MIVTQVIVNLAKKLFSAIMAVLVAGSTGYAQPSQNVISQGNYKLTILDSAATSRRADQGRVSSQAVVEVTDENDDPVSGIIVTFTIPQVTGGGAEFANGGFMMTVPTNNAGIASSGPFTAQPGTTFDMAVTASTPGAAISTTIPVALSAAAVSAGLSTAAIVGIIVGIGAAAAAGVYFGTRNSGSTGSTNPGTPTPTTPTGTIGSAGVPVFGGP